MVAGLATADSITNPDEMFSKAGINLVKARADSVDRQKKIVALSDGSEIPYDKLLLAVGASPVMPQIEGTDLRGVFTQIGRASCRERV